MFDHKLEAVSKEFALAGKPLFLAFKGKAGAGKDTTVQILQKIMGGHRFAFADRMKAGLKAMGFDEPPRDQKEDPNYYGMGFSFRDAGQTLGTDWGRERHKDIWVNRFDKDRKAQVSRLGPEAYWGNQGTIHYAPDLRFGNEGDYTHTEGGVVVEVRGRSYDMAQRNTGHASENQEVIPDFILWNHGTIDDLEVQVIQLLGMIASYYAVKGKEEGIFMDIERAKLIQAYLKAYVEQQA